MSENFKLTIVLFFLRAALMFTTYEPVPETWEFLERFAKVFDQTYTRFLDLTKSRSAGKRSTDRSSIGKSEKPNNGHAKK